MPFAPKHDYEFYNAAMANRLQSQPDPGIETKFQRYADYYNTMLQTRQQLGGSSEARLNQKRETIIAHARLLTIYRSLDGLSDEK